MVSPENEWFPRCDAWDVYGAKLQKQFLGDSAPSYTSEFLRKGRIAFDIPPDVAKALLETFFDPSLKVPLQVDDSTDGSLSTPMPQSVADQLNKNMEFFSRPGREAEQVLIDFLESKKDFLERQLGGKFRIGNVRPRITKPSDYGPTAWHADHGARFLRKIMMYPQDTNIEYGTIEYFTRDGEREILDDRGPSAVLLDVAQLLHRGRSGKSKPRPSIELILTPAETTSTALVFAGQNACIPPLPQDIAPIKEPIVINQKQIYPGNQVLRRLRNPADMSRTIAARIRKKLKAKPKPLYLSSGVGTGVSTVNGQAVDSASMLRIDNGNSPVYSGWLNLVAERLDAGFVIPLTARSVKCIYVAQPYGTASSPEFTGEVKRVLAPGGIIAIKCARNQADGISWQFRNGFKLDKIYRGTAPYPMTAIVDVKADEALVVFKYDTWPGLAKAEAAAA